MTQIRNHLLANQSTARPVKMSSTQGGQQVGIIIVTSLATFISGFLVGVWSITGYIISPSLREERRRFHGDPIESDESDIDEDDTTLDHAPSWVNGVRADQKQGLRASALPSAAEPKVLGQPNEECKLVLVVRTDLGMTKGKQISIIASSRSRLIRHRQNRSAMLPRDPRMLQGLGPPSCQLARSIYSLPVGKTWPGQNCRADQVRRGDARAATQGSQRRFDS